MSPLGLSFHVCLSCGAYLLLIFAHYSPGHNAFYYIHIFDQAWSFTFYLFSLWNPILYLYWFSCAFNQPKLLLIIFTSCHLDYYTCIWYYVEFDTGVFVNIICHSHLSFSAMHIYKLMPILCLRNDSLSLSISISSSPMPNRHLWYPCFIANLTRMMPATPKETVQASARLKDPTHDAEQVKVRFHNYTLTSLKSAFILSMDLYWIPYPHSLRMITKILIYICTIGSPRCQPFWVD